MKRTITSILGAFVFILLLSSLVYSKSKSQYEYVNSPKSKIYFGHISFDNVKYDGKDPIVIREGRTSSEIAVLNLPLAPGDTIRSTDIRRCEIQLDTGTIIRLGLNTELKIETILAQSLSSKQSITNFVLNQGQIYIMYKQYDKREVFQVITPNAAVKMKHKSVAFINAKEDASTDIHVKEGKADILYGPKESLMVEKEVKKSQKLTVSPDHFLLGGWYEDDVDFELWNENMNENFLELHKGISFIPAPIQTINKAVFNFAQKFSNQYGEWVWDSLYGWVWRPFYNDSYPWGNWQPYFYGQWREVNGELFWVPQESWGWVPYHLGYWVWNKKLGWLWIPGSVFAPAWAAWDFYMGYYTWRPWSMTDWYYYRGYYSPGYTYARDGYYPYYFYYTGEGDQGGRKVLTRIRKDQLKRKQGSAYKLPSELKRIYSRITAAIEKRDERILESMRKVSDQMIIVKREDLNSRKIQNKAIRLGDIATERIAVKPVNNSYKEAVRAFNRNSMVADLKEKVTNTIYGVKKMRDRTFPVRSRQFETVEKTSVSKKPSSIQKPVLSGKDAAFRKGEKETSVTPKSTKPIRRTPSLRFRDWNPDAKVALKAGVSIKYISRNNEIRCPELRISSRNGVVYRNGISSRARLTSSGGSNSGGGSGGGGSSSGSSSGAKSSGSSNSSSGSSGGSKGGGGGKKR
ncbi:MAG: FecR domain-containing protein [Candidatus Aminicenantes bacterium]|nr:MAG: FecR domain-containing protein [Candidatus Aminicenantes bacterium]